MPEKDFIPITETPYASKLAKDYLLGNDIGINNPIIKNYDGLIEIAKAKSFNENKRKSLADALLNQYSKDEVELNLDSKVYQNIQFLKEPSTFTFTTGQQIHILLGPLFFIYKIQSLLRHVTNFNALSKGYKAVPVFWMATEDHDLEEINYVKLYGETFSWQAESGNTVGRISCKGLPELIDQIEARADKTVENKKYFSLFRKHYSNEKTLAAATRSLLNEIFGMDGLIIIDPDDKTLKRHFAEIAKREIEEKILFNSYNAQNNILKKKGYEPKVNAQEINYFWLENSRRVKLKIKDGIITKSDSDEQLTLDQIIQNIEKLSPNVITRAFYQETILPNLLYIGGNAEIEYWLPLQESFKKLNLQFPALIQRDSVLNISIKNLDTIEKAGFHWPQLFNSEKEIIKNYSTITSHESFSIDEKLETLLKYFQILQAEINKSKIKTGQVFKEINDIQKGIVRLSKLISDEKVKLQKNDPLLNRVLKIKEKLFDKRLERDDFVVGNFDVLDNKILNHSEFYSMLICNIT